MSRKHLSPEGLRPCTAEVRSCRYGGHINDNGTFSTSTTVEDMEAIVSQLATEVTSTPGNTEGLELYFQAKTNMEAAKTQSTVLSKQFIDDMTKNQTIAHRLDPDNPNPTFMQILRDRFSTQKTSEFTVEHELRTLAKHPQLHDFQRELVSSIINREALLKGVENLSYHNRSSIYELGNNYELVKAFFHAPAADEGIRIRLLQVKGLTEEQKAELADQTIAGWVHLAGAYDVEEYGRRGQQEMVKKADAQLAKAPDNSISPYTLYNYLKKVGDQSTASDDTIIRTATLIRADGRANTGGATAASYISRGLGATDLSVATKVKTVQLARRLTETDTARANPEQFLTEAQQTWGTITLPVAGGTPDEITVARTRVEELQAHAEQHRLAGHREEFFTVRDQYLVAQREYNKLNILELSAEYKEAQKKGTSLFASREVTDSFQEKKEAYLEAAREELWDRIEAAVASSPNE